MLSIEGPTQYLYKKEIRVTIFTLNLEQKRRLEDAERLCTQNNENNMSDLAALEPCYGMPVLRICTHPGL
jgi:hypothetical protein